MTTPEALNALADRVEREEPSFELDSTIYEDALPVEEKRRIVDLPAYTTSLDAAVTLVPEGWFWRVGYTPIFNGWAHVSRTHADHCVRKYEHLSSVARNPTLALTAAALRARAALEWAAKLSSNP